MIIYLQMTCSIPCLRRPCLIVQFRFWSFGIQISHEHYAGTWVLFHLLSETFEDSLSMLGFQLTVTSGSNILTDWPGQNSGVMNRTLTSPNWFKCHGMFVATCGAELVGIAANEDIFFEGRSLPLAGGVVTLITARFIIALPSEHALAVLRFGSQMEQTFHGLARSPNRQKERDPNLLLQG